VPFLQAEVRQALCKVPTVLPCEECVQFTFTNSLVVLRPPSIASLFSSAQSALPAKLCVAVKLTAAALSRCRVLVLQAEVEKTLSIPPSKQKLMYKGLLKDDAATLQKVRQTPGLCACARACPCVHVGELKEWRLRMPGTTTYATNTRIRITNIPCCVVQVGIKNGAKVLLIGSR
jgi:hypothetical protein